jgi:hypothetical protein
MELVRLVAPRARLDAVVREANDHATLFQCSDADTVLVAASMVDLLTAELGVWLEISSAYRAQLAARDVATLAAIVPLRHVVIEAPAESSEHADVVRSLLTNDEVNFSNNVATIVGAFNRPAPPRAITVWSYKNDHLVSGKDSLVQGRIEKDDAGERTYFA